MDHTGELVEAEYIQAYAVNSLGVPSLTNSVQFVWGVTNLAVVVDVSGQGKVTPNYNGQFLAGAGKKFTMSAVPATGFVFSYWFGGVGTNQSILSTSPKLTFVMTSNLVLQANFAPDPIYAARGTYHGLLFDPTYDPAPQSSGAFTLTMTGKGAFSGFVQRETKRYAFTGRFPANGFTYVFARTTQAKEVNLGIIFAAGRGGDNW